jgi:hypothetical protein
MKLAIVMPPYHPMPPSPGGGVERLVDILLHSNEISVKHLKLLFFHVLMNMPPRQQRNLFIHALYI